MKSKFIKLSTLHKYLDRLAIELGESHTDFSEEIKVVNLIRISLIDFATDEINTDEMSEKDIA